MTEKPEEQPVEKVKVKSGDAYEVKINDKVEYVPVKDDKKHFHRSDEKY